MTKEAEMLADQLEAWAPHVASGYEVPAAAQPMFEAARMLRAAAPTPVQRDASVGVLAALAAAISLLERTPNAKKAAPSDKMFAMMISDYKKALEVGRAAARPSPNAGLVEREALKDAFMSGADAVHEEWLAAHERGEGPPHGDTEFSEAADDYVTHALLSTRPVAGAPVKTSNRPMRVS